MNKCIKLQFDILKKKRLSFATLNAKNGYFAHYSRGYLHFLFHFFLPWTNKKVKRVTFHVLYENLTEKHNVALNTKLTFWPFLSPQLWMTLT